MTQQIVLSGIGTKHLRDSLRLSLIRGRPRVIGVVAAFVSTEGIRQFIEILKKCGEPKCRLIAGTDNAITHPEALFAARDQGWKIRLGRPVRGIFHPKLVVAGRSFSRSSGTIQQLCCVYVGSSNLTNGGLSTNVECGLIADAEGCLISASDVFAELWNAACPATDAELRHYAARFAECARRRAVSELVNLGVADSLHVPTGSSGLRVQRTPSMPAIGDDFAVAAWTGLQSFTSEYRFQVEFPKSAGKVISKIIRAHVQADGRIDVYCPDNETTRPMQYKFYPHNSMFRLNVPNDVPGVAWAREHKDGLAIVEQGPSGGAPLRIRLLKPGADAKEIVSRSAALGTWGKTSTRSYGWY
jgi:HKD family nuclease